ncbi:MAG: DUF2066 domain-containing protein [Rhodospirillales bacterium]
MPRLPERFSPAPRFAAALLAAVLALASPPPGGIKGAAAQNIQTGGAFTVAGVPVDVTAEAAAEAREQALGAGETRAFNLLLRRLTESADHYRLPTPPPESVTALVRDFSLRDEKISSVRYIARMTVRFHAAGVRDLLLAHGIPFAETIGRPLMIAPVLDAGSGAELWTDSNPWRFAWAGWLARAESAGLRPFVLPIGDLTDIGAADIDAALLRDETRLGTLAERYGASATLIAQARWRPNSAGGGVLEVALVNVSDSGAETLGGRRFIKPAAEADRAFLERAAAAVWRMTQDDWVRANRIEFDRRGIMAVAVPVRGIADWLDVKRRLDTVPVIEDQEVVMLNRTEVRVNLHFLGTPEQLTRALEQAGLLLHQNDNQWVLYPEPS